MAYFHAEKSDYINIPPTAKHSLTGAIKKIDTARVLIRVEDSLGKFFAEIANRAKANIDDDGMIRTGLLRKAVDYKIKIYRGSKDGLYGLWAGVGINKDIKGIDENGKKVWPVKYAHLIEYGHDVKRKKNGKVLSVAPPYPFMRSAIAESNSGNKIPEIVGQAIAKGVEAQLR